MEVLGTFYACPIKNNTLFELLGIKNESFLVNGDSIIIEKSFARLAFGILSRICSTKNNNFQRAILHKTFSIELVELMSSDKFKEMPIRCLSENSIGYYLAEKGGVVEINSPKFLEKYESLRGSLDFLNQYKPGPIIIRHEGRKREAIICRLFKNRESIASQRKYSFKKTHTEELRQICFTMMLVQKRTKLLPREIFLDILFHLHHDPDYITLPESTMSKFKDIKTLSDCFKKEESVADKMLEKWERIEKQINHKLK